MTTNKLQAPIDDHASALARIVVLVKERDAMRDLLKQAADMLRDYLHDNDGLANEIYNFLDKQKTAGSPR